MRIFETSIQYKLIKEGENILISSPEAMSNYMQNAFDNSPHQESLWIITMNSKLQAIGRSMVSLGTLTECCAHPRDIFRIAILAGANSFAICHNHPSGDPSPSEADHRITRKISEGAEMMQIKFIDHLILGHEGLQPVGSKFFSFKEHGLL